MSYRVSPAHVAPPPLPSDPYCAEVVRSKTYCPDGSDEPTVIQELEKVDIKEYAREKALPHSEDYQLRDMLAAGVMPEQVNVSGMLDSQDPCDLSNVGVADNLFNELADNLPPSASDAATVVDNPSPATQV